MSGAPTESFKKTLDDPRLQLAVYSATKRLMDHRASAIDPTLLPDYQALRDHANQIKKHTIEHLDHYLEQLETNRNRAGREGGVLQGWRRGLGFRAEARQGARRAADREIEIHDHRGDPFQ